MKLTPPRTTAPVVPRAGAATLAARDDGVSVILVCAPAGYGKTSFLRSLYDAELEQGHRAVWLRLDPADNDPQRFADYLGAALDDSEPATFDSVVAQAASLAERFSLFLDDAEAIRDPTVTAILRDLAESLPAHGRMLLAGRQLPELRLGRLRAEGRVLEIGADQLRFTAHESEQLLGSIAGRRLAPALVARLHDRTDGWAAALQLAALALRDRSDPAEYVEAFSGTSAELGSYLAEEIFISQPDEIRSLLMRASILDTFSAELCDVVCERTDSEALLRRIQHDNLFLFGLDERGEWFRLHALFAEFLRRELRQQHPEEVAMLHRRAAEWFAGREDRTTALEHALRTEDADFAADMAEGFAPALTSAGRLTTLIRAVGSLPPAALDRRQRLKVHYATALTGTFQHRRAAPLFDDMRGPDVIASLDVDTRGVLLFAIPFQMLLQDRFTEALAACETNLEQAGDRQGRAALMNVRNVCLLHLGRYAEIDAVEAEVRWLATGVTTYGLVYAECIAGTSELAQGRLTHATAIYEDALATALAESSSSSAPSACAAAALAEAYYEAGRLESCREVLDRYLTTITHLAIPDGVISAHMHHIRLTFLQRGYPEACEAINDLKRLGYERDLKRLVATSWAEHSRLALRRGDVAAAARYLQMAEASGPYRTLFDESSTTLRARMLIASGDAPAALELLDSEIAGEHGRRYALKLAIIRALALRPAGRTAEALRALADCVEEARGESFVRVLADEGAPLAGLLREMLATRTAAPDARTFVAELLASIDAESPAAAPDADSVPDAVSTRELEVLGLIADGLSNQAIADRLVISLATVKTHVRSIMGKLGADNRTDAVAAARRHHLV